jgi:DICT domain-containing protein
MVALSHAIEDESLARAERQLLFGCFQRRRFYRQEHARWRELGSGAELAVVFADFERARRPRDLPAEVPIDSGTPLFREWALVCDGEACAVCLVGREPPHSHVRARSSRRAFEMIWSVEPDVVRDAARICAKLAARALAPFP